MQIQAYQQYTAAPDNHEPATPSSSSSASEVTPQSPENAAPENLLLNQLRSNPAVQHYIHGMLHRAGQTSFDAHQEAQQAPAIIRQRAHQLGMNLPDQLQQFSQKIQQPTADHASQRYVSAPSHPSLIQQLAGIDTNA
ncbi:hypothetical protein [Celerinatantimonas sp. YJH-8]|uniref:hypothetical protein n=1 Tax=Celerinatantimonas sp. YJH-8 TaxID=3228714 RepID=UPI0038C1D073